MTTSQTFGLDLKKACEKAGEQIETAARAVMLDLFSKVINKSPVGNPDGWKSNKAVIYARETHNLFVDAYNADLMSNSDNLTRNGNLKRGVKKAKALSSKSLRKTYQLKAGKGYVGGRFRANWNVAFGAPDTTTTEEVDPSGNKSKARMREEVLSFNFDGKSVFLSNSLPYSMRLEYGYSKQAPAGMVRLSLTEITNQYGA